MFNGVYPLISLHLGALLVSALLFIPQHWIRWGWLWYLQILLTEWIAIPLTLSILFFILNPSTIWLFFAILFYLKKRRHHLFFENVTPSFNSKLLRRDFGVTNILWNLVPFKRPLKNETWHAPDNSGLKHLKFSVENSRTVCIHIHGGAWKSGDAQQLSFISHFFIGRNIEMLSINYEKYPKKKLKDIVDLAEETFLSIYKNYDHHTKFILYGRSAGAHLALMLSARHPSKIDRVVALYPVTDLKDLAEHADPKDLLGTPQWLQDVIGGSLKDKEELYAELSPTLAISKPFPPVLIVHGENDPVVTSRQSDILYERLVLQKIPVFYLKFSKGTHGFDALWNGLSMQTFRKILDSFLKKSFL